MSTRSRRASGVCHGGDRRDALAYREKDGVTLWSCHTAGCRGGDVYSLVMSALGISFPASVAWVADFVGAAPGRGVAPRPRPVPTPPPPSVDLTDVFDRLPPVTAALETYLRGRGLWTPELPADLVRGLDGRSGHDDLDRRFREGGALAFPVRDVGGRVRNISIRHGSTGFPGEKKTVVLTGCTTRGVAICRPEIALLAKEDALAICEGGPDALAADLLFRDVEPTIWALGCIGVGAVPSVIDAFKSVIRERVVYLALDSDAAGEAAVLGAVPLLVAAGARRVARLRPSTKDIAQMFETEKDTE